MGSATARRSTSSPTPDGSVSELTSVKLLRSIFFTRPGEVAQPKYA